jgi:hypothetical protein
MNNNQNATPFNDYISFRKFISLSFIQVLVVLGIFLSSCTQNKAPEFDHYGVYLKTEDGFVELINRKEKDLPRVNLNDGVTLYVFSPKAKTFNYGIDEGYFNKRRSAYGSYYDWKNSRSIDEIIAPVGDHPEMIMIKISVNDVFGGQVRFIIKDYGNYYFEIINLKIQISLINWMRKNLEFLEAGNYLEYLHNSAPDHLINRNNDDFDQEGFINRLKENPEELESVRKQLKDHLKMLDEGREIKIDRDENQIFFNNIGYEFIGNGKWTSFR